MCLVDEVVAFLHVVSIRTLVKTKMEGAEKSPKNKSTKLAMNGIGIERDFFFVKLY